MEKKRFIRIVLLLIVTLVSVIAVIVLSFIGKSRSRDVACVRVEARVCDSSECKFVTAAQVRKSLRNTWEDNFIGLPSRDIKMSEMEEKLKENSAVREAEIYMTPDGILHVDIWQRHPVAKFVTPSAVYYIDKKGTIFRLGSNAVTNTILFEGPAPLDDDDFISETIDLCEWISGKGKWAAWLKKVRVDEDGCLTLYPKEGKEQFVFGGPGGYETKFKNISRYYNDIKPVSPDVRSVNVKFEKRIICRKTY